MSAATAGASPAREAGGSGRAEWLRVYDRMAAILRKNHRHIEALLADRSRLEALLKIHHDFWLARDALHRDRLSEARSVEACVRRRDAARLGLLLGVKDREARRYQIYAKNQDEDLEDFKNCVEAMAAELKMKQNEAETSSELSENTREHGHSGRKWRAELRELKTAYKKLSSEKDKEVSALVAQKDFVWHQLKTMEKDYDSLLKKKKLEAAQATEAAQRLQQKVEELQAAAQKKDDDICRLQAATQKKDDDIGRLQAEAISVNKKILLLESKLQKLHFQDSEEDDETQKVKGGHLQASQKQKKDTTGTHRRSRSEGGSLRGKSKNNPRKQMAEDQPETSQKRQCSSSLSNALALRRSSSRLHLKPAASPGPQQLMLDTPDDGI